MPRTARPARRRAAGRHVVGKPPAGAARPASAATGAHGRAAVEHQHAQAARRSQVVVEGLGSGPPAPGSSDLAGRDLEHLVIWSGAETRCSLPLRGQARRRDGVDVGSSDPGRNALAAALTWRAGDAARSAAGDAATGGDGDAATARSPPRTCSDRGPRPGQASRAPLRGAAPATTSDVVGDQATYHRPFDDLTADTEVGRALRPGADLHALGHVGADAAAAVQVGADLARPGRDLRPGLRSPWEEAPPSPRRRRRRQPCIPWSGLRPASSARRTC